MSFIPNDMAPHSLQVFNLGFNALKPKTAIIISKRGRRINIIRKLLNKLIKKLKPKIGININTAE